MILTGSILSVPRRWAHHLCGELRLYEEPHAKAVSHRWVSFPMAPMLQHVPSGQVRVS
jgi:hypothetical protein